MKQNFKVSGVVRLNEEDVKRVLLILAKEDEAILIKAVDAYLKKKHGIAATKITVVKNNHVVQEIKVEIEAQTTAEAGRAASSISKLKQRTGGFTKSNVGFYNELTKYFDGLKRKRQKSVEYEVVFKTMLKLFPALTDRKFYIYTIDKRQWQKRGFSFDSKSRIFNF